jgi:hypothetical protein
VVDRLRVEGRFDLFSNEADHRTRYRLGRELNGTPAPSWGWDDLE